MRGNTPPLVAGLHLIGVEAITPALHGRSDRFCADCPGPLIIFGCLLILHALKNYLPVDLV